MNDQPRTILALDVGEKRIGVARANSLARLASPLTTLTVSDSVMSDRQALCQQESATVLVLGLPRNLSGQDTAQTQRIRDFGEQLAVAVRLPIVWQDEAVTSEQAEAELKQRGKPYGKGDIDALAATYILEDYIRTL
jgi:putative Holliday junction resolvase